jgi:hypothetical protein
MPSSISVTSAAIGERSERVASRAQTGVSLELLDHRDDAVVPADPQVVSLRDVMGEDDPRVAPTRESTVNKTLRSRDCASSTTTKASCRSGRGCG